jgi:hypothetical protein
LGDRAPAKRERDVLLELADEHVFTLLKAPFLSLLKNAKVKTAVEVQGMACR